jgi:sulfatase maturation enzyme AslB (radical SAM superfamily)
MINFIKGQAKKINFIRKHVLLKRIERKVNLITAPKRLIFEPTDICNFACYKCLYPEMKRPKGEVDIGKYSEFLKKWKQQYGSFEVIEFTGSGEVLVFKNFVDLIKVSAEIMPSTKLMTTSNLALLTEKKAKELLKAGLRYWQVSLDSIDREEFRKITGADKLEMVVRNIKILWNLMQLEKDEKNNLVIVAHRPFDKEYKQKMREIEEFIKPFCTRVIKSPYQTLNSRKNLPEFQLSEQKLYLLSRLPCEYLWQDLVAVFDGSVRVCCSDMYDSPINFGNIFTDDPSAIVNNEKRRLYQKRMFENTWDKLYLCNTCHSPRS